MGFAVGDTVQVEMPKGLNKRGVRGVSVMYTTSPEARFDHAVGDVIEINPRGPNGVPLYLVSFVGHQNRVAAFYYIIFWIECQTYFFQLRKL